MDIKKIVHELAHQNKGINKCESEENIVVLTSNNDILATNVHLSTLQLKIDKIQE